MIQKKPHNQPPPTVAETAVRILELLGSNGVMSVSDLVRRMDRKNRRVRRALDGLVDAGKVETVRIQRCLFYKIGVVAVAPRAAPAFRPLQIDRRLQDRVEEARQQREMFKSKHF